METLKIDIQSEQEKKVLIAFLDSLHYQYSTENDEYVLSDIEVMEMVRRKEDHIAGKISSRPWDDIKKRYEGV